MGKSQRTKGATAEREFTTILSEQLGQVVKRKLGQSREGGDDVQVQNFRFEVKRRETLALPAWCRQVEAACAGDPDAVPVVAYRQNGQPWRVVLKLSDFLPLMAGELRSDKGVDTISTQ